MDNRSFLPGQNWLYFKIYCGFNTSDEIISKILYPFSNRLIDNRIAKKWFFIRYADPHSHIRFRIKLHNGNNNGLVINEFSNIVKPYFDEEFIWNVKIDTYNREIERYGKDTIDLCEDLFMHDSNAIAQSIPFLEETNNANESRWIWAFLMLDSSLSILSENTEEKMKFITHCKDFYSIEFNYNNTMKVNFDTKFRRYRGTLTSAIESSLFDSSMTNLIDTKQVNTTPIIAEIRKRATPAQYLSLATSINHMMINRIFRTKQRLNEFALYQILHRYHISTMAKEKYAAKNSMTY
ncbi:MAG: thiopeptide-type bacteriocin biosynthesis protein [Bacteroidales bacterium]